MIQTYRLVAELKSPLSISIDRRARTAGSLSFIPGSAMRGAIADMYLKKFGMDSDFNHIFLSGDNIFPYLYPSTLDAISYVIPSTAVSCKRESGFNNHGVKDTLFLKGALAIIKGDAVIETENFYRCNKCANELKPFTGFWNGDLSNPSSIKSEKIIMMHSGIDRTTGTVAKNILFGIEAVEPMRSPYMSGILKLSDRAFSKLTDLISLPIFMGKAKTRGYGELKLSIESFNKEIKNDLIAWSDKFKFFSKKIFGVDLHGFYFSISLQSDAIILDKFLRYSPNLEDDLIQLRDTELIIKSVKMTKIRGWNYIYRLPKFDEWAIEKGAVYLYRYNGVDLEKYIQALREIEEKGIGIRKEEGFGKIKISDPFHAIFSF